MWQWNDQRLGKSPGGQSRRITLNDVGNRVRYTKGFAERQYRASSMSLDSGPEVRG